MPAPAEHREAPDGGALEVARRARVDARAGRAAPRRAAVTSPPKSESELISLDALAVALWPGLADAQATDGPHATVSALGRRRRSRTRPRPEARPPRWSPPALAGHDHLQGEGLRGRAASRARTRRPRAGGEREREQGQDEREPVAHEALDYGVGLRRAGLRSVSLVVTWIALPFALATVAAAFGGGFAALRLRRDLTRDRAQRRDRRRRGDLPRAPGGDRVRGDPQRVGLLVGSGFLALLPGRAPARPPPPRRRPRRRERTPGGSARRGRAGVTPSSTDSGSGSRSASTPRPGCSSASR